MKKRRLLIRSWEITDEGKYVLKPKRLTAAEIRRARRIVNRSNSAIVGAVYQYGGRRIGDLLTGGIVRGDVLAEAEEIVRSADAKTYSELSSLQ